MGPTMEEIILIDKPIGLTSFDVIRQLHTRLGVRKIGHAGTLDPLATGLMILGVGPGTKRLTEFIKLDKIYEAQILIGERRSTGDLEGTVIESVDSITLTPQAILEAVTSLVGTMSLPVSAYSAIKKNGVALYQRARQAEKTGEPVVDIPLRDMRVYETAVENIEAQLSDLDSKVINRIVVTVKFYVGSGTYIRSLAEELGRRLGYPATLQSLRRTKVGEFSIEAAKKLEDF